MTYLRFHWIFNLPLLLVLYLTGWRHAWSPGEMLALAGVVLAAVVFTTPWDNIAVKRGIWDFPAGKYSRRILYLPVEEYLFFVLQSVNVMTAIHALFWLHPDWHVAARTSISPFMWLCLAGSVPAWILIGLELRRWGRRVGPRSNYALHLVWFLPVIYVQWLIAPSVLGGHAGLLALVTCAFGLYYTIADFIAVCAGLWFFDDKQITGWKLLRRLPWEEIAFFFLTSLLVAQSFLLLMPFADR